MYMRSRWGSLDGRYIIEKKYHSLRAMPLSPKQKEKRAPRQKETPLSQEKINKKYRAEKFTRLCLDNFAAGDSYLTLTYAEKPAGPEQVKKDFEAFKKKLRRIFHRGGKELKYISVLENLKSKGRPHAHILIPALSVEEMQKVQAAWPEGKVRIEIYQGGMMDAKKLMEYFTKEDVDKETGSGRVMPSRNLIRREPKKTCVTRAATYRDEIVPPPGYAVIKPLSYCGRTEEGYPLQVAVFERLPETPRKGGERHAGHTDKSPGRRDCLRAVVRH